MTPPAPIFIIGTERSGSNLLRLILNAHSQIAVPHPPHIMAYFGPLEKYYGDLRADRNWSRLVSDVVTHVHRHIYPWPNPLEPGSLTSIQPPRDLFDLYAAIYEQHRAAAGKARWGCKSTFMIHYTDRILARYPRARLVWLVRDPRDVAVSSRQSVFNPYHPYYTARLWNSQQVLGLSLEARLSPDNLLRVYYEDLITDPEETVSNICAFVGVDFEPAMLRFFETPEAKTSSKLARDWRNTGGPILKENASRFRNHLSGRDIATIEREAAPTMKKLGYEPVAPSGPGSARLPQRCGYRLANEFYRVSTEYQSLRENRNHWRRWGRAMRIAALQVRLKLHMR